MKNTIIVLVVLAALGAGAYFWLSSPVVEPVSAPAPAATSPVPAPAPASEPGLAPAPSPVPAPAASGVPSAGTVIQVAIKDFSFSPGELKIKAGTKVVWTNQDIAGHTVTSDSGEFGSRILGQGKSFEHIFSEKGTFAYHCEPHPFMKARVIVE